MSPRDTMVSPMTRTDPFKFLDELTEAAGRGIPRELDNEGIRQMLDDKDKLREAAKLIASLFTEECPWHPLPPESTRKAIADWAPEIGPRANAGYGYSAIFTKLANDAAQYPATFLNAMAFSKNALTKTQIRELCESYCEHLAHAIIGLTALRACIWDDDAEENLSPENLNRNIRLFAAEFTSDPEE